MAVITTSNKAHARAHAQQRSSQNLSNCEKAAAQLLSRVRAARVCTFKIATARVRMRVIESLGTESSDAARPGESRQDEAEIAPRSRVRASRARRRSATETRRRRATEKAGRSQSVCETLNTPRRASRKQEPAGPLSQLPNLLVRSLLPLWRLLRRRRLLLLALVRARDDLVDAQQHRRRLHRRLERLDLDGERLPHAERLHVCEHALLAVDAPRGVCAVCVLGAQLSQHADDVGAAVLEERARDHLEGGASGAVGVGDSGLDALRIVGEVVRQRHLRRASAGQEPRVEVDGAQRVHRIAEVALHLVEHVLARPTQHDRARLWLLAVDEKGEKLVAHLRNLKQAAARANVLWLDLGDAVDDGGAARARDTVVVRLAHAADARNVGLDEVVLREVGDALLSDDDVDAGGNDVAAHLLDRLFFDPQQLLPRLVVGHLDRGGALVLLVLKRAVKQQHTRVGNLPAHLRVNEVLVHHHALEHPRVLDVAARDLLDLGVPFDVELLAPAVLDVYRLDRLERERHHHRREARDEFGARAALHQLRELGRVVDVEGLGDRVQKLDGVVEGLEVAVADDRWVEVTIEQRLGEAEVLARKNDDGRRAVANLLLLRTRELDHTLRSRVAHVHLTQDRVAVVRHDDSTHRVEQHLQHGARAQRCAHNVRDCLTSRNVAQLSLAPSLALNLLVHHHDRRSHPARHGCAVL
mmetsp:Transcript_31604/g.60794  ORF Transcript_31604/g.60794 Transcript_31604/m.60794 type:complete len:698 (+) Transcript_31604:198-2291(+)